MTDREFEKFIGSLTDDTDVQYAREDWECMTKSEQAECTVEDMKQHIEATYEVVAEQRIIDIAENKIFVAVLDDNYYREYGEYPAAYNGKNIKEEYVFDTPEEFVQKWYDPGEGLREGDWYWVFDNGKEICSGAIDPNDIELFEDYFGREFEVPVVELEDDVELPDCVVIKASELALDVDDICDDKESLADIVSDYLSDTYGFCHKGFGLEVRYNEFNEPSEFVATDIQWNIDEVENLIENARERSAETSNEENKKREELVL